MQVWSSSMQGSGRKQPQKVRCNICAIARQHRHCCQAVSGPLWACRLVDHVPLGSSAEFLTRFPLSDILLCLGPGMLSDCKHMFRRSLRLPDTANGGKSATATLASARLAAVALALSFFLLPVVEQDTARDIQGCLTCSALDTLVLFRCHTPDLALLREHWPCRPLCAPYAL
jgi:hypothetical protein